MQADAAHQSHTCVTWRNLKVASLLHLIGADQPGCSARAADAVTARYLSCKDEEHSMAQYMWHGLQASGGNQSCGVLKWSIGHLRLHKVDPLPYAYVFSTDPLLLATQYWFSYTSESMRYMCAAAKLLS